MNTKINFNGKKQKNSNYKKFLTEIKLELKRVTWPTKNELLNKTKLVLAVIILSSILVWVSDTTLTKLLSFLLELN